MRVIANILIGLVAALHIYIAWFEMFAWTTRGPAAFPTIPEEIFPQTVSMAANQGLYNAFLAAGLIWALTIRDRIWSDRVAYFFLLCVAVAGVFGALTVTPRIALIQSVPAVLAIGFVWASSRSSG
ncbi:MAG: DUF1304 domain-containing protein [Pseudomonadota bacterium]